ncbi:kelch motif-containing protein [Candidatus Bathyarchaeota archaeon]|nr:kelch motif-containing protein [Candidatus Bathyarchaeota archaeon]
MLLPDDLCADLVFINGKMILFGGSTGGSSQLSDTWLYDYGENIWSEITTQPRPPVRANSDGV